MLFHYQVASLSQRSTSGGGGDGKLLVPAAAVLQAAILIAIVCAVLNLECPSPVPTITETLNHQRAILCYFSNKSYAFAEGSHLPSRDK